MCDYVLNIKLYQTYTDVYKKLNFVKYPYHKRLHDRYHN
jgi:hypothetical protein